MTTLTQGLRSFEFLISEGNGQISRDSATLAAGDLVAGTVLGKVTATGKYKLHDAGASDGTEDAVAVLAYDTDASSAEQSCTVVARLAEVSTDILTWKSGISAANKAAGILNLATASQIVAR